MKSMKSLSMNKMLGSIKRRPTDSQGGSSDEPPDIVVSRYVKSFCQSDGTASGDEVTYLPPIVELAESSPAAAAECARMIRKYMQKDHWSNSAYQRNAVMLLRILSDHPGPLFTRHINKKFVDTVRALLGSVRDLNVRQGLMETLNEFEVGKSHDEGLAPLVEMWRKEKAKASRVHGHSWPAPDPAPYPTYPPHPPYPPHPSMSPAIPYPPPHHNPHVQSPGGRSLPSPADLTNMLEEARTSAKLLEQMVASTSPNEVLSNDLLQEFSQRCQTATQSLQAFMAATEPAPDNDTMESLIDTNEQLQQALNTHQRAALNARKYLGLNERSNNPSPRPSGDANEGRASPAAASSASSRRQPQPQSHSAVESSSRPNLDPSAVPTERSRGGTGKGKEAAAYSMPGPSSASRPLDARRWGRDAAAAGVSAEEEDDDDDDDDDDDGNPFRDPAPARPPRDAGDGLGSWSSTASSRGGHPDPRAAASEPRRLALEPYHPDFGGRGSSRQGGEDIHDAEDAFRAGSGKDPVYRY